MAIDFAQILSRLEAQQQAANKENLKRYQELLAHIAALGEQTHGTYESAREKVGSLGEAARTRIERGGIAERGRIEQDLISRGLGNTTIRGSALAGQQERERLSGIELDEMLAGQQANIDLSEVGNQYNIGALMARAIEGRTDAGPNMSLYSSLLQSAAANQGPVGGKVTTFVPPSRGGPDLATSLRSKFGTLPSPPQTGMESGEGGPTQRVKVVRNPGGSPNPLGDSELSGFEQLGMGGTTGGTPAQKKQSKPRLNPKWSPGNYNVSKYISS